MFPNFILHKVNILWQYIHKILPNIKNLNTQYSLYSLRCQEALAGYNLAGGREKTAHSPLTFVQESHCTQWDI